MASVGIKEANCEVNAAPILLKKNPASPPRQELSMQFVGRQIGVASFVSSFTLILTHPLDTVRVGTRLPSHIDFPSV